jgi:hypothetical protein
MGEVEEQKTSTIISENYENNVDTPVNLPGD